MDERIILNPDYRLKNDETRISFSSLGEVSSISEPSWGSFIHPIQACILSFFTHGDSYNKCIEKIGQFLSLEEGKVEQIIAPFIENKAAFFTKWGDISIDFPKNVLIRTKGEIHKKQVPVSLDYLKCDTVDLSTDRFIKGPQYFTLMLNNRCVTSCKYCYADKDTKVKEMSTEKILDIIDQAKQLEVNQVDIIGGEVFLKKNWDIIVSKLVENNLGPGFISTKFPVTLDIVKKLKKSGYNNVIQISLDSLNEETLHDLIGVGKNYKKKLLDGLQLLQEYGFEIQINTILTKCNSTVQEMNALFEVVKRIKNLAYWEVRVPNQSVYSKDFDKIKPNLEEIDLVFNHINNEIIPQTDQKILLNKDVVDQNHNYRCEKASGDTFGGGICGSLYDNLFVLPDGKITLCEELYWHPQFIIGDLNEMSLQEIWKSEKAMALLKISKELVGKDSTCGKCSSFQNCSENHKRCWLRVIRSYGLQKWNYPDPYCEKAPVFSPLY